MLVMEAEVSSRRTRVQYGKAAKRVNERRSTAKQNASITATKSGDTQDTARVEHSAQTRSKQSTSRLDVTQGVQIEPLGRVTRGRSALSPAKPPQPPPKCKLPSTLICYYAAYLFRQHLRKPPATNENGQPLPPHLTQRTK